MSRAPIAWLCAAAAVAGCHGPYPKTYPTTAAVIPDVNLRLSAGNTVALEKIVYGSAGAALLYHVYDPLAPNWRIEESRLADDTYHLSMKLKAFHTGGSGEAMLVMRRRALHLQRELGYAGYRITDYAEGIESTTPQAQRFSEGIVRLVRNGT